MPHSIFTAARETPALGGWITLDALPVMELLAGSGFDYIGIDTQHSLIDIGAAARLLYAAPIDGPPVLVRVPSNDGAAIGKILDCGAHGVIVPMVNSAADARAAVAACNYYPKGVRSFGPIRTHIGRDVAALQDRAACFAMIETTEALANLEAIVSTPGLTGIYLGPADLAVSMGLPPAADPEPPALVEAVDSIAVACAAAGIVAGGHGLSAKHVAGLVSSGYRLISLTADKGYMMAGAAAMLKACRG